MSAAWPVALALGLVLGAAPLAADVESSGSDRAWPGGVTTESASLIASSDGQRLYSANFDAGTLSRLASDTGERLAEARLGRDLRRVASSGDSGVLAVSDYAGGSVILVDSETLEVRERVSVGARPFGVVFDPARRWFWIALFEDAELVALDPRGRERARLSVAATPRGLALTRDGRLLVTHALLGTLSIVDVRADPPELLRTVELATRSDADPFLSQGSPRLLDDIAISPDQSEAWLPHVLWSFGHPFQFRSTVFPAISVVSLERGREHERVDRRKELFRQIDLRDAANKTRIVSNPHDVAFSPDGGKAYVTFSGSEDLVVFDLTRRASESSRRRSRRRGKQSQGGAQAIQILRHLPGNLPLGLVVGDRDIFVQNAQSLDVSKLNRGGDGPFARVKVEAPAFASLVAVDPISADRRRGQRLFFSANSDEFAQVPLAGDFWMSCASCHLDGFNFTNRFLLQDAALEPKRRPGFALAGHRGLEGFVAREFVGDYIRMIQHTQGGMGADERMQLPRVDPDAPPSSVVAMMNDLHAYVTAPDNLPYLSTWLRLESPARHAAEAEWTRAADCAECHSEIHAQWQTSNHHRMGRSHPYYMVLEDLAAEEEGEEFRAWCMGCHNPKLLLSGRSDSHARPRFSEAADPLGEGTDCVFCHRVSRLEHAGGNASLSVNLQDRLTYPFESSRFEALRWFSRRLVASRPKEHAESYRKDFYDDARYCGSCHSEFTPGPGAVVSDTYAEWEASPFNRPDAPESHRSCLDCHMHADPARVGEPIPGRATDGGALRPNVRTHGFSGANVDLLAGRDPEAAARSLSLLRSAAELELSLVRPADADRDALRVRVRNVGAGHHLPTGVADFRQLWLYVRATSAQGAVVLETGELDASGRLSADARIFNKVLGDEEGRPVGLRFWRYATLLRDSRIPAGAHRDEVFALPADVSYPLSVVVELRFRTFPREISERVRERFPELELPSVHRLARVEATLETP